MVERARSQTPSGRLSKKAGSRGRTCTLPRNTSMGRSKCPSERAFTKCVAGAPLVFPLTFRQLKLQYLNLYLIHHPSFVPDIESAWKQFERIKDDGLAKSIGVSNFTLEQLQIVVKSARILPAVNQVCKSTHLYRVAPCRHHSPDQLQPVQLRAEQGPARVLGQTWDRHGGV